MNNLVGVLVRFREQPVAIMADIQSMFHQVKVRSSDRDVLRFLWWPNSDPKSAPKVYRMTVHPFGGIWSPSCTSYALKRTAMDNSANFDVVTVETVDKGFYVDDCLTSVGSEVEAIRLSKQLVRILSLGGFRLTKWVSNSRSVLESIPQSERATKFKSLDLKQEILPNERALGLRWNVILDEFSFEILEKNKPLTKRGILSTVSSVFDPLGFVGPFILSAKIILQELCRQKIGWDDSVPERELSQWMSWCNDLNKLEQFSIKRCIQPPGFGCISKAELHHFSDASRVAYGVVSYIRLVDDNRQIHCSFLSSKCRLAPLKETTIPRLELSAAALAVKVDMMLRRDIGIPIEDSVFWTDSTLVLQYIDNEDKRFQTFVANRISAIHDGSTPAQWHHVGTKSNPADDASRGLTAAQLIETRRWLHGPEYLWQDECKWPQRPVSENKIPLQEVRRQTQIYTVTPSSSACAVEHLFTSFSSWYRLKKAVAWILKVKKKLLDKAIKKLHTESTRDNHLTVDDLRVAECEIVKYVQTRHFSNEIRTLKKHLADSTDAHLKRSSPLIRLDPMLTPDGVMRVGGRLKFAPLMDEAKHQAILPKKHHVVDLIIRHYHEMSGHSGREHVLSLLRQKFWILRGRRAVSSILTKCVNCRKCNAMPGIQKMADLPEDRITPDNPPFSAVGIDYFGPIMVTRGRSLVKRYGCVFTCLTIRAIHIEVTHSLDTSAFINALQRFISRRGRPNLIRSDNGTNFVGANRELREALAEWNQDKIVDFLRQREITWIFNPPSGSHMGGVWERLIRTIRKVMRSVLRLQTLDDESLPTFMCLIESIVNSRPITVVSEDSRDPEALTPNHLLLLRAGPELPPGVFVRDDLYSRRRWRQIQYLANVFWRRWLSEYLPSLQEKQKWLTSKRDVAVGDVVLILDENTPRSLWPMAIVTETYPGRDGRVRTVRVKTQSSSLVRPIDKLVLLETV